MIETVLISESNEIAYLNCILKNESLLLQSVESVTAEMFGCKQTREIYTVILNLFEQSKQVSKENLYGVLHSENSTYLSVIYKQKVNIEYFNDYLYNLKNKFLLRQYKSLATDTNKLLETNITGEELNEIIQTKIVSINQQTTSEINDFESNLFDVIPNPDTYTPDQKREFFGISSGLRELDKITVGFHNGCYTIIGGRPSCVAGDTVLNIGHYIGGNFSKVKSRRITIENLYQNVNNISRKYVTTWDNSIPRLVSCYKENENLTGLNAIEDVLYQGVKDTYTVITNTGKTIRTTIDHKFLANSGQFVELGSLSIGSKIICKADKITKGFKKPRRHYPQITTKMPYYKNSRLVRVNDYIYQQQSKARVTWDAHLNNLTLEEFVEETRNPNNRLICSSLNDEIHHIDGNPANNHISNLKCLTKQKHRGHHKHFGDRGNFGLDDVQEEEIVSITYYGKENVYDLSCLAPYHNFIGNGFVLHNCSKTLLVRQILTYNALQGKPVAFFSMDESEAIIKMKIVASITGIDYNHLKKQELNKEEIHFLKKNIDTFKKLPFFIDTTPNLSVAVLRTKIKKLLYRHPSLCAIAVDYVQQMDGHGNTAHEKLANISKGLKGLAQEFKLPLFVISQLSRNVENRAVEYDEKWTDPPLLSDLRESGALEADMDKGIFLKIEPRKDEFGNFKEKIKTRVFVLKQRDGEAGLFFDTYTVGKIQRIEEIQHTNNLMF